MKPHSPIAWFVALNTSFKDQTIGSRVFRFHPEQYYDNVIKGARLVADECTKDVIFE